ALAERNPARRSLRRKGAAKRARRGSDVLRTAAERGDPFFRPRDRVVEPPRELAQAGVEHGALRFGLGDERLDATAELGLDVGEASLERRDELLLLTLEPRDAAAHALLEPLP